MAVRLTKGLFVISPQRPFRRPGPMILPLSIERKLLPRMQLQGFRRRSNTRKLLLPKPRVKETGRSLLIGSLSILQPTCSWARYCLSLYYLCRQCASENNRVGERGKESVKTEYHTWSERAIVEKNGCHLLTM